MKTNKKLIALLLAALLTLSLSACGGSAKDQAAPAASFSTNAYYAADEGAYEAEVAMESEAKAAGLSAGSVTANGRSEESADRDMSEKIIYNADVRLETTDFDAAVEKIAELVKEYGGYMESTSISGSNYSAISRGSAGTRSASYTIRVPSENFGMLTGAFPEIGNVPYSRTYTRNVTTQYYDVQSRLEAYRVQEKRLLEMLSIAETVEDMLAIQRELTDVQYEIDSLTGTLRYYDNQVGYSTVDLTVQEVREYTPEPTVKLTYWERMSKQFKQSVHDTGEFFSEFFLWFVTSLPWMIPLALAIALVIWLIRRRAARDPRVAERRAARREAREQRRAEKAARKAAKKSSSDPGEIK